MTLQQYDKDWIFTYPPPPRPYPSWELNAEGLWEAPILYPDDGNEYVWDEENVRWTTGSE